jgi:hypothetical protein
VRLIDRVIVSCIASTQLLYSFFLVIVFAVGRGPVIVSTFGFLGVITAFGLFTGRPVAKFIALVWQAVLLQYTWANTYGVVEILYVAIPLLYLTLTALFLPFKPNAAPSTGITDSTTRKGSL